MSKDSPVPGPVSQTSPEHTSQAKRLRDRATMNILTVDEPYPDVTKKIVRQLLSRVGIGRAPHCRHASDSHRR
jgi:hypothetical protein